AADHWALSSFFDAIFVQRTGRREAKQAILGQLPGLKAKTTGIEQERTHGCTIARLFIKRRLAMQSRFILRSVIWMALYLAFILGPMFALLLGSHPPARDFWTEFSAAIGY